MKVYRFSGTRQGPKGIEERLFPVCLSPRESHLMLRINLQILQPRKIGRAAKMYEEWSRVSVFSSREFT